MTLSREKMRLRPITVKRASALGFVAAVHRRLPRVQGAMWGVSVVNDAGEIVGVILVGHPSTHTHLDEPGISLRASGWLDGGLTAGGEHDRPSRARGPAIDAEPKRRWWAPGSMCSLRRAS